MEPLLAAALEASVTVHKAAGQMLPCSFVTGANDYVQKYDAATLAWVWTQGGIAGAGDGQVNSRERLTCTSVADIVNKPKHCTGQPQAEEQAQEAYQLTG